MNSASLLTLLDRGRPYSEDRAKKLKKLWKGGASITYNEPECHLESQESVRFTHLVRRLDLE